MNQQKGRVQLKGVRKIFDDFEALKYVDLEIKPREFFALLGPSGSGKTTTLRIISGLETANEGQLIVDEVDVTHVLPQHRDVAMVFQNYALYPHMTIAENIAFPLKMAKVPKNEIPDLVKEAASKVKIDHLLHRRPGQLSGGQQQRVALARAVVRKPRLFLLDEPLSNLDAQLRLETRVELKSLHRNLDVTTVYVTHDQEEAMTLADRMAVFIDGQIKQIGTPEEIFDRPQSAEVAAFIGSPPMNLFPATLKGNTVNFNGQSIKLTKQYKNNSEDVIVGIRPSHISLGSSGIEGKVYLLENLGESMLLNVYMGEHLLKVRSSEVRKFKDQEKVSINFDPKYIHLFDKKSGNRL